MYAIVRDPEYLQHHGVLGMRWGKHKVRNESPAVASARSRYEAARNKTRVVNPQTNDLLKASHAKQDLRQAEVLDRIKDNKMSSYEKKQYDRYQNMGYNKNDARYKAYCKNRTKNALIAVGATAATAAAIYGGKKYCDYAFDKTFKSGFQVNRIDLKTNPNHDTFYASYKKHDVRRYKELYGTYLSTYGEAVEKKIKMTDTIKQISPKHAQQEFESLMTNNSRFKQNVTEYLSQLKLDRNVEQNELIRRARRGNKKAIYETINTSLVDHSNKNMNNVSKIFYDHLESKGYNALKDANDSKYSGYNTKNPMIMFATKGKAVVDSITSLDEKELLHLRTDTIKKQKIKESVMTTLPTLGFYGAISGGALAASKNVYTKKADVYMKEHPNTDLDRTQIERKIQLGEL